MPDNSIDTTSQIKTFLQKHHYLLSILVILLLTTVTRFANFDSHWGIGNDDARDVAIAQEALRRKELPLIGSFSSAGPFVFGPLFYWTIMFSMLIFPFAFTATWIFTGLTSIGTVLILIITAYQLVGRKYSILVGVLGATSPQMVSRSLSLGQHSYVAFTTSLLILFFILLWKHQKLIYACLMGFVLGVGLSMHYQVINLLLFFPLILLIPHTNFNRKFLMLILMGIGFLIPSLPLFYWDSQQQFANIRNLLDYLLIGQYRIYVPNSWRIFLFQFFPYYWSFVIGVYPLLGFFLMFSTGLLIAYQFLRKQLSAPLLILAIVFACLAILNRYYRGERSEGYLLYFQPFIILLTSYSLYLLTFVSLIPAKYNRVLRLTGMLLIVTILATHLIYFQQHLTFQSHTTNVKAAITELKQKFPNTKFSVYDYKWQNSTHSQPLGLLLHREGLIDPHGQPIGFACAKPCKAEEITNYPVIAHVGGTEVVDLRTTPDLSSPEIWFNVNPPNLYDDLMYWSKNPRLKSNFTF